MQRKLSDVYGGLVAKLYLTLCNPMDCIPPESSVHGILQARILEWIVISFQGIFRTQESNLGLLHCRQILYQLSLREADVFRYPETKIRHTQDRMNS